jgi:hypothetical protein
MCGLAPSCLGFLGVTINISKDAFTKSITKNLKDTKMIKVTHIRKRFVTFFCLGINGSYRHSLNSPTLVGINLVDFSIDKGQNEALSATK